MPYLPGQMPLKQTPESAHIHFLQLTSAVAYLHERGITHNDIKPQNVVISNRNVAVLIDFGFANMYSTRQRGAFLSEENLGTLEVSSLPTAVIADFSTWIRSERAACRMMSARATFGR